MRSVCVVELHGSVDNIKIVLKTFLWRIDVSGNKADVSTRYFCPILTNFGF